MDLSSLVIILFVLAFGVYFVNISDVFSRIEKAVFIVVGVSGIVVGLAVLFAVGLVRLLSL